MSTILDSGISPDSLDAHRHSAFSEAVLSGQKEVLRELVRRKVNINVKLTWHSSPLRERIQSEDPHMVSELLKLGADINLKNEHEQSTIIFAKEMDVKYKSGKSKAVLIVLRKWIIENQIPITDKNEIDALDIDEPESFARDFVAFKKEAEPNN